MKHFILVAAVIAVFSAQSFAQSSSSSLSSSASKSSASSVAISSLSSLSSSSKSSTSSSVGAGKFDLRFGWRVPTLREDGTPFYYEEILGYDIRYRKLSETTFKYIQIGPAFLKYQINNLPYDDYLVEIAVFDVNGLYSQYVTLTYIRPPAPLIGLILKESTIRF